MHVCMYVCMYYVHMCQGVSAGDVQDANIDVFGESGSGGSGALHFGDLD